MNHKSDEYTKASELLSALLSKDFELIAEMFCDEIADQLYDDFMKDRSDEKNNCIVDDIEKIKELLTNQQLQISKMAMILRYTNPLTKGDDKLDALEETLKALMKAVSQ